MPYQDDDWDDEDEWADPDEEENDQTALCPECGGEVSLYAEACPACGYWLTERDRRSMDSGARASQRVITIGLVALALAAAVILASWLT